MFESNLNSVIAIDTDSETIHFYSKSEDGGAVRHEVESYRARPFDDEFFAKFQNILRLRREKAPTAQAQKVALILPDRVFLTDTINIPVINKRAMNNSLTLAINALYKNSSEIRFSSYPVYQNKQFATYSLLGLRTDLITRIKSVCEQHQISVQSITFAANAAVDGAMALNSKLKNGTYLLLDIKETDARFAFVTKGRTMGYYSLPFGYSMLYRSRVASEDILFDHAPGDLLVLNAKEKARAKQLTLMAETPADDEPVPTPEGEEADTAEEEKSFDFTEDEEPIFETRNTYLPKKTARKLPKFMLRPTPQTKEEYMYENFRIFVKWALDLIVSNPNIVKLGAPEAVYVNMPEDYKFLFDMVNTEAEENKVTFEPLAAPADTDEEILENLELFGGFYLNQFNRHNNF